MHRPGGITSGHHRPKVYALEIQRQLEGHAQGVHSVVLQVGDAEQAGLRVTGLKLHEGHAPVVYGGDRDLEQALVQRQRQQHAHQLRLGFGLHPLGVLLDAVAQRREQLLGRRLQGRVGRQRPEQLRHETQEVLLDEAEVGVDKRAGATSHQQRGAQREARAQADRAHSEAPMDADIYSRGRTA